MFYNTSWILAPFFLLYTNIWSAVFAFLYQTFLTLRYPRHIDSCGNKIQEWRHVRRFPLACEKTLREKKKTRVLEPQFLLNTEWFLCFSQVYWIRVSLPQIINCLLFVYRHVVVSVFLTQEGPQLEGVTFWSKSILVGVSLSLWEWAIRPTFRLYRS